MLIIQYRFIFLSTFTKPSGCGKTTVLNCIGGFIKVNSGKILLDNQDITNYYP